MIYFLLRGKLRFFSVPGNVTLTVLTGGVLSVITKPYGSEYQFSEDTPETCQASLSFLKS